MGRQDLLVLMVVVILVTINGQAALCTLMDLLFVLPLLRLLDLISLGFVVSARCQLLLLRVGGSFGRRWNQGLFGDAHENLSVLSGSFLALERQPVGDAASLAM